MKIRNRLARAYPRAVPWYLSVFSPHFSPGCREQVQDSCSKAPLWSEKRSDSYGLSEEQAYGREDQPEP